MLGSEIKSLSKIIKHYIDDERHDYFEAIDETHIYKDLRVMEKFLENDKQLNRCPRCGESDFEIIEKDSHYIWVICLSCKHTGPTRINEESAMRAWNNRT